MWEAFASWLTSGKDDEDDFADAYWKYVGRSVISFTSLTDAAGNVLSGRPMEVTALTPLKQLGRPLYEGWKAFKEESDVEEVAFHTGDLVTTWYGFPALTAYKRIKKQVKDWADED
jgi:hypothetical protein